MQRFRMKQGSCRQAEQRNQEKNCSRANQRIRCCGRVTKMPETSMLAEKKQGRGLRKGQCKHNDQGQRMGNRHAQLSNNSSDN